MVIHKIEEGSSVVELSIGHNLDKAGNCPCGATVGATYKKDGSGYARYITTKVYTHKSLKK
jgi:hypothetical protein